MKSMTLNLAAIVMALDLREVLHDAMEQYYNIGMKISMGIDLRY